MFYLASKVIFNELKWGGKLKFTPDRAKLAVLFIYIFIKNIYQCILLTFVNGRKISKL